MRRIFLRPAGRLLRIRSFRRLAGPLFGIRSPSEWAPTGKGTAERWADLGASMIEGMKAGIEQAAARRAELLASGMTPEEVQAVMYREMAEDPGFKEMLEYSHGVVMRSFGSLYEDDGEEPTGGPPSASAPGSSP